MNAIRVRNIQNGSPLRDSGISWSNDVIKMLLFKPELNNQYSHEFMGFEFHPSNARYNANHIVQFGCNTEGKIITRNWDNTAQTWKEHRTVYSEGNMPTTYNGKRVKGKRAGDMMFDVGRGKPIWWNGTAWIEADGTVVETIE